MKNIKVAFIDSGIGGLIFGIESILNIATKHDISNLSFLHIGDTKNVPYGLKTEKQLLKLITDLTNKAIFYGAKIIVIGCNTACTVIDEKFINEFQKLDILIINIIKDSAKYLYNNTKIINNEMNIAILATKQTIGSMKYKQALEQIHGDIYHDNKNIKLNVYSYSPIEWEQSIENNIERHLIKTTVYKHLDSFKEQIGKNFHKINSVGLFCTHYPYFLKEIKEYFNEYQNKNNNRIQIIGQGSIFSEIILEKLNLIDKENKNKNKQKIRNIKINSYITGDNIEPIKNTIQQMYPNVDVVFDFCD